MTDGITGNTIDRSVFRKRVALLRKALGLSAIDTAWIVRPESRRYLSGFKAGDTQFTESSGSLLINETSCVLVTDSRYISEAGEEAKDFETRTLEQGIIDGFPDLMSNIGTEALGFDEDYLTWGLHRQLTEKLAKLSPPVRLLPLNGVVEEMRMVKDPQEIRALETSAGLISVILDEVEAKLKPGLTEKEVAWQIQGLARELGAEDLAFPPIVASGPNSALPHAAATERKIDLNEPVILDLGVKVDGYCSDMTRTFFLSGPGPYFREVYRTVRQAQLAALDEIRPGVNSNHPDAIARQVISDAGFGEYFGHSVGHGVGLATHERPRLGPSKPTRLEKGMVVTVEPGIYIPGKGGVRLEQMAVIEEDGPRVLSTNRHLYDFFL